MAMKREPYIRKAKRVVLKLGTKVLLSHHSDADRRRIDTLATEMAALKADGYEFIVVSSGAVGFGMNCLDLDRRPEKLQNVQALAAIGQNHLMQDWSNLFSPHGIPIGQVLLTYSVLEDRRRYLHAKNCLSALLDYGAVPIVNENDAVSVDELKFGDNDALSAITALITDADLLILFTDTDGLYDRNPKEDPAAERLRFVERVDDEIRSLVQDKTNAWSLGGMGSKLQAAQRSAECGGKRTSCRSRASR